MNRNTANVCQMCALSVLFYLAPYGKASHQSILQISLFLQRLIRLITTVVSRFNVGISVPRIREIKHLFSGKRKSPAVGTEVRILTRSCR